MSEITVDPELEHFLKELESINDDKWRDENMSCVDTDQRIWFDDLDPDVEGPRMTYMASTICHGCPVIVECLDNAMAHDDVGIRAGLTESQRNVIYRHRVKYRSYFNYDLAEFVSPPQPEPISDCGNLKVKKAQYGNGAVRPWDATLAWS